MTTKRARPRRYYVSVNRTTFDAISREAKRRGVRQGRMVEILVHDWERKQARIRELMDRAAGDPDGNLPF